MNMIDIQGVSKTFDDFSVSDVSLSLPAGTIMGLVGENGAGKTTVINMIMNAVTPDRGRITVMDTDTRSEEFINTKQKIAVIPDAPLFPGEFTAEQVNKIMSLVYTEWSADAFYDYLARFRIPRTKRIKHYSKGMGMKLSAAAALSHNAKLLIMDEATSGLDPFIRDELLDIVNEFTRDESRAALLSSHIVSDLDKVCDYIAFIHGGRLVFCEEKDRLKEDYLIVSASSGLSLPTECIAAVRPGRCDTQILVRRDLAPPISGGDRPTLEEIILFMVRTEKAETARIAKSGELISTSSLW